MSQQLQLLDHGPGREGEDDEVGAEVKVILGAGLVTGELRAGGVGRVGGVLVDADHLVPGPHGVKHLGGAGGKGKDAVRARRLCGRCRPRWSPTPGSRWRGRPPPPWPAPVPTTHAPAADAPAGANVASTTAAMARRTAALCRLMAVPPRAEVYAWRQGCPCDPLVASTCLVAPHWPGDLARPFAARKGRQLRDSAGVLPDFADQ